RSIKGLTKVGELSVSVIDEDKIKISLYRGMSNRKCSITDEEIPLTYDEYRGFKAIYGTLDNNTPCGLELTFRKISSGKYIGDSIVKVDQLGWCLSHCDKEGTF